MRKLPFNSIVDQHENGLKLHDFLEIESFQFYSRLAI